MKNKNKLKRCIDFLNNHKEEIQINYEHLKPSKKEILLLNYLSTLKTKLKEQYKHVTFCEFYIDEYGNKWNLCSSIIQVVFPFDKGNTYREIYSLIKNYFSYEIFLRTKLSSLLIPNISLIFDWKIADCTDLANLVVSCLRTKNYEAYVVCGEAPSFICSKNDKNLLCTFNLKQFLEKMEQEENIIDIEKKKKKYEQLMKIQNNMSYDLHNNEEESNFVSNYYIHMWVLIKKSLDLEKDIFVEMTSGREYDVDVSPYKSIHYLWNEKNIYINITKSEKIGTIIKDLKNKEYFVQAFYEEMKNKVLSPIVRNQIYKIREDRFLLKYPHGCNTTFFKKCKKDEYAENLQLDGLIEKHTHYESKYYTTVEYVCSFYKNRKDNKIANIYFPQRFQSVEYYDNYSHQFLRKYEQKLGFYTYYAFYLNRPEGLTHYFEIKDYKIMEYYQNRNDNIIYRSMNFSFSIKTPYTLMSFDGREYFITKISIKYKNECEDNCIRKKIFLIPENKIIVCYYNNDNRISNSTHVYEKHNIYNEDREEYEEILMYKKNLIFKHYINYDNPSKTDVSCLLKEERVFYEDMKQIYNNVISSILKNKQETKETQEAYQYMSENITNLNEIVFHKNEEIYSLNKNIVEDNINIYKFYQKYPWTHNSSIALTNLFFTSKQKMITIPLDILSKQRRIHNGDDIEQEQLSENGKHKQTIYYQTLHKEKRPSYDIDQFTKEKEESMISANTTFQNTDDIKLSILENRLTQYKKQLSLIHNSNTVNNNEEIEQIKLSIRITEERINNFKRNL